MSFWKSGTGTEITGDPDKAFMPEFGVIPNGTTAVAKISEFKAVEQDNAYTGPERFLQIKWKITEGEFFDRTVIQKIKVFDGKPEQIDRALNMLKLIMDLCQYKPTHSNAPTDQDLAKMCGKTLGIKIREWHMPKKDGSGMLEGNFVSEVHPEKGFEVVTGKKMEPVVHHVDSALTRNADSRVTEEMDSDIPF